LKLFVVMLVVEKRRSNAFYHQGDNLHRQRGRSYSSRSYI